MWVLNSAMNVCHKLLCLFVCFFIFHGRPDGIGTITVDEKTLFEEIKIRLWNLLAYQITHYR